AAYAHSGGGAGPATPPTTTTNPPRDFTAPSVYLQDPDVLTIDPAFGGLIRAIRPSSAYGTGMSTASQSCGPKVRPGTRLAITSSSATFPTTASCAGLTTT